MSASTERATAAAVRACAVAEKATVARAMVAANTESARATIRADVALARVEAIHAKTKDAHTNIFQATSESNMQPTSEKVTEAIENRLPHEIAERVLEMQEAEEIKEHRVELHMAEDEVEKSLSVE
ncbi:hypothetical protein ZWY2020_014546 [Hordeum vulgare]|nr:hypothetical protein ZWY2020_014546 [Hordeum vulgare]